MLRRASHSLLVLLLAVAAHFAYARLAVPLIEPQVVIRPPPTVPTGDVAIAKRIDMLPWFSEGDWALNPLNKILETPDGILVLEQYRNQPDGTVVIEPCAMIFLARGGSRTEQERAQQATILEAPRAVLRLDQPLDLKTGRIGRLIGGRLDGPVSIRSRNRQEGPEDDLDIRTKNVEMTGMRVVTDETVDFRLGPNHGHGKRLRIELLPGDKPSRAGPSFSGMKSLELLEDVWMHIDLKDAQGQAAAAKGAPPAAPVRPAPAAGDTSAVEVSCRGRFRFDVVEHVATFNEEVHVVRVPTGATADPRGLDQLDCQQLSLFFSAPKPPEGAAPPPAAPRNGLSKLSFERLLATGPQVLVRSPSRRIEGRGGLLEWNEKTRTVRLNAAPAAPGQPKEPAWFAQASNEIVTGQLECQLDDKGGIQRAHAVGPGNLRGEGPRTAGTDRPQPLQASWTRELQLGPDGELRLIRLFGEASVTTVESGQLRADEIYLWLLDRPAPPAAGPAKPLAEGNGRDQKPPAANVAPHKMAARGRVEMEAQPLTGRVGQLEVWFDHREPPPVAAAVRAPAPGTPAAAAAPAAAPAAAAPAPPPPAGQAELSDRPAAPAPPSRQRFQVEGELLRARLVIEGKRTGLGEAWIEGQVRIKEITALATTAPLALSGDTVHLVNDNAQIASVRVTGQPGQFEGQGLTLEGPILNVSQAQNRLWVEGPGLFRLPVKDQAAMPGAGPAATTRAKKPAAEVPLEVRWQGDMKFDGLEARFRDRVSASLPPRMLTTSEMIVRLTNRVDFSKGAKGGVRPEVETVECPEQFLLEGRTLREAEQVSTERMEARGLKLNQRTGLFSAQGPGGLVQVRRGAPAQAGAIPFGRPEAPAGEGPEDSGLKFLSVRFLGGLSGNMPAKEVSFLQQVETLYGPVDDWEHKLSVEELRPSDLWLRCEKLTVRQSPVDRSEQVEMEADDNVRVRGREFTAWGGRMSFNQAKDLLILEGDARTEAQLSRQPRVGGPIDRVSARKIYFWPSADHVKLEGSPGGEVGNFGGGGGGEKRPVPPVKGRP